MEVAQSPSKLFGTQLILTPREIIDESDVFIDVHKAIRRMAPAPQTRAPKGKVVTDTSHPTEQKLGKKISVDANANGLERSHSASAEPRKASVPELGSSPKVPSFLIRRRSSGNQEASHKNGERVVLRSDDPDFKQHLKHLGPSNVANRPKSTRINTVKIKPGMGIPNTIPENQPQPADGAVTTPLHAPQGGVGEGLLDNAGLEASDGVHSVAVGYGTMTSNSDRMSFKSPSNKHRAAGGDSPTSPKSIAVDENTKLIVGNRAGQDEDRSRQRSHSVSTIGSLPHSGSGSPAPPKKRNTARSGSISENVIDLNGVKKIVLETTSSDDDDKAKGDQTDAAQDRTSSPETEDKSENTADGDKKSKKKRKKRGKKNKKGGDGENQPLLDGDRS
jgi:metal transporter CNNM